MTTNKQDDPMISQIKQELDAGLDQLDPAIAARLRAGRNKAMAQATKEPSSVWAFLRPQRLAGFATAIMLLILVSHWHPSRPGMPENRIDEMELLAQQGSLDMYKDMDFYAWLAKTDETH